MGAIGYTAKKHFEGKQKWYMFICIYTHDQMMYSRGYMMYTWNNFFQEGMTQGERTAALINNHYLELPNEVLFEPIS